MYNAVRTMAKIALIRIHVSISDRERHEILSQYYMIRRDDNVDLCAIRAVSIEQIVYTAQLFESEHLTTVV